MFKELFNETSPTITYNDNADLTTSDVKYFTDRYKHKIVRLPKENYTDTFIYIPEMSINFNDIVFTNHTHYDFKYILTFNDRLFILSHTCFCGKRSEEFNSEYSQADLDRIKLVKDGKDEFVIVPEIELSIDDIIQGRYTRDFRVKSSWLVCLMMKLVEIKPEDDKAESFGEKAEV